MCATVERGRGTRQQGWNFGDRYPYRQRTCHTCCGRNYISHKEQVAAAREIEQIASSAEENSVTVAQTASSAHRLEEFAQQLSGLAGKFRVKSLFQQVSYPAPLACGMQCKARAAQCSHSPQADRNTAMRPQANGPPGWGWARRLRRCTACQWNDHWLHVAPCIYPRPAPTRGMKPTEIGSK